MEFLLERQLCSKAADITEHQAQSTSHKSKDKGKLPPHPEDLTKGKQSSKIPKSVSKATLPPTPRYSVEYDQTHTILKPTSKANLPLMPKDSIKHKLRKILHKSEPQAKLPPPPKDLIQYRSTHPIYQPSSKANPSRPQDSPSSASSFDTQLRAPARFSWKRNQMEVNDCPHCQKPGFNGDICLFCGYQVMVDDMIYTAQYGVYYAKGSVQLVDHKYKGNVRKESL